MVLRVLMLGFAYYPADPRIRREAEALVDEGMSVDVMCLRDHDEPRRQDIAGVSVFRISLKRKSGSKLWYVLQYACFLVLAAVQVSLLHLRRRYDVVHVHNMPDLLIFAALIPKLTGARLILDLHDPMPEVYVTKYTVGRGHLIIRLLMFGERWSIKFSDIVFTPNIAFRDLFVSRGCPSGKIRIVMNSPDRKIFQRGFTAMHSAGAFGKNEFVLMYHGTIVERHGLDIALEALASIRTRIPDLVFHVYGRGNFVEQFLKKVTNLRLEDIVQYHGHVPLELIARAIRSIDVGLIPNRKYVFTDINLPTRIFEYLCMGKSVIAPRTKGILDYFDESSLHFFEPGNVVNLAEVILEVYAHPEKRHKALRNGVRVCRMYSWEREKRYLVRAVYDLLGRGQPARIHPADSPSFVLESGVREGKPVPGAPTRRPREAQTQDA